MARILLTWELGGGMGHAMNLRSLAAALAKRGHQIFLAAKDLSQVRQIFAPTPIVFLQAPWKSRRTARVETIVTFADLLFNVGFGDHTSLAGHVQAWRNLYALVAPDLIVCDHSPTALLAARGTTAAVATVGTGFFCPIDETPLGPLRDIPPEHAPAAQAREARVLDIMNSILGNSSRTPASDDSGRLERVTQLYHDGRTKHFLLTFPELDHYPGRTDGDYRGAWPYGLSGEPFVRTANGKCIFAYLKPLPGLSELLARLSKSEIGGTVYIDGWSKAETAEFQSERLHFVEHPIDIRQAAEGCDAALTNANHGTCVAMLLAGKPLIHVPPFVEQSLFAAATDRLGTSITVNGTNTDAVFNAIEAVFNDPAYTTAAASFATRHRDDQLEKSTARLVDDLETLVSK